jgi:exodeoxyribonuclease VIII
MNPGIYYDLSEREYRQAPGVSQSALKAIARSPAHYRAGLVADDEDTEAKQIGRIAAALVLEKQREPWWILKPDNISFNEKEGKDWAREALKWDDAKDGKFPRSAKDAFAMKGIELVSASVFNTAAGVATALVDSKKPEVRALLDDAQCEVSVFADCETPSGVVRCKCRPDIVPNKSNCISDLKTTLDARPSAFLRSIRRFGYAIQGASYVHHWNTVSPDDPREIFLLLAVEKEPPFAHCVYQLDADFMREGLDEYMRLLNLYAFCEAMNEWPDYEPGIVTLSPYEK